MKDYVNEYVCINFKNLTTEVNIRNNLNIYKTQREFKKEQQLLMAILSDAPNMALKLI